jgi:hypothetical protein
MSCCSSEENPTALDETSDEQEIQETTEGTASVTEVSVSGEENQYTFSVTISSTDLGCQHYADWWEVIDLDGNLLYRRILAHSHVNEQPFTRSGGPVEILEAIEIYVRAHMNSSGYGTKVFKGSISGGFTPTNLDSDFAKKLEETSPLPNGCAF